MIFTVTRSGTKHAITGELDLGLRQAKAALAGAPDGGELYGRKALEICETAVTELLKQAPHKCHVSVSIEGAYGAHRHGGVIIRFLVSGDAPAVAPEPTVGHNDTELAGQPIETA